MARKPNITEELRQWLDDGEDEAVATEADLFFADLENWREAYAQLLKARSSFKVAGVFKAKQQRDSLIESSVDTYKRMKWLESAMQRRWSKLDADDRSAIWSRMPRALRKMFDSGSTASEVSEPDPGAPDDAV